ncbi:uncharacterized protein [Halyomorpha halys]|uniref:uncharacterized protein n=1 Tax=Halyomorpha halys TaxID=286706 RepID=UPI0006D4FB0A|nr:uncharacterized protein LOC106690303 [Halyomorpha halys]
MNRLLFYLVIASVSYSSVANVNPTRININGRQESVFPLVTISERPACSFRNKSGACCLTLSVPSKNENVESCIRVEVDNQNNQYASLVIQDHVLFRREVRAGEQCYPIQSTPLTACLNIYYLNIDPQRNTSEACFFLNISKVLTLDFKCIKYNNGQFEYNTNHTAETEGLYKKMVASGQEPMYFTN